MLGMIRKIPKRLFSKKIGYILGETEKQKSEDVELRGIKIKGNKENLPNLIFFPDMFDRVEHWLNFFTDSEAGILDQRNVYLLYPRNFGNSDHCEEKIHAFNYGEHVAKDVERFMYQNKISTATMAGHGFGAKTALLASTYQSQNVTGFIGLDYSPLNYRYHEFVNSLKHIVQILKKQDWSKMNRNKFTRLVHENV